MSCVYFFSGRLLRKTREIPYDLGGGKETEKGISKHILGFESLLQCSCIWMDVILFGILINLLNAIARGDLKQTTFHVNQNSVCFLFTTSNLMMF